MMKLRNILLLLPVALCVSSCDPYWHFGPDYDSDGNRGYMLSGRWFGDLGMMVDGQPAVGSVLEFVPDNSSYLYGYGTETDYYYNWMNYLDAIQYSFEWEIRDRCIYMYFRNPDLNCRISDYRLSSSYFEGYIENYGYSSRFQLRNYDRYWNDFGYGTLYAKPRSGDMSVRSVTDSIPVCIRRFSGVSDSVKIKQ